MSLSVWRQIWDSPGNMGKNIKDSVFKMKLNNIYIYVYISLELSHNFTANFGSSSQYCRMGFFPYALLELNYLNTDCFIALFYCMIHFFITVKGGHEYDILKFHNASSFKAVAIFCNDTGLSLYYKTPLKVKVTIFVAQPCQRKCAKPTLKMWESVILPQAMNSCSINVQETQPVLSWDKLNESTVEKMSAGYE